MERSARGWEGRSVGAASGIRSIYRTHTTCEVGGGRFQGAVQSNKARTLSGLDVVGKLDLADLV